MNILKIITSLSLFLVTTTIYAQDLKVSPPPTEVTEQFEVFHMASVQQKPEFPGGDAALFKYVSDSIRYPSLARENGIQGKVIVSFLINKDGSINDVKVLRGIGGGCDEEAVRLVKAMPNWTPGRTNGKNVNVKYTQPVNFSLR